MADHDETSFVNYQKSWSADPTTWDGIVDEQGRRVFIDGPPVISPQWKEAHWWWYEGAVLLDQDNHPLRDIPGLNRAFSSELEGWHLDALRKRYPYTTIGEYVSLALQIKCR